MTEPDELRGHFEAILGRDLGPVDPGEVALRENVGAFTIQDGRVARREIGTTGDSTKGCFDRRILDVGGVGRTGSDGTAVLRLRDFSCGEFQFEFPVTFVATPRVREPALVTMERRLVGDREDVEITVWSWTPEGQARPGTSFDWHCRVPYEEVFVVD